MNPIKFKFLPTSFLFSFLGLAFSAYNIYYSSEAVCFGSSSCELFVDFTVLGISLWWFGIVFFFSTLISALFGLVGFGKLLSGLGVLLDIFLLIIMLSSALCGNCLIVGSLIALVYIAFYWDSRNKKEPLKFPAPFFIFPWIFVFIMTLGDFFTVSGSPFALAGKPDAEIRVYFSTNCPSCATLVEAQGDNPEILWIPVQEGENDVFEVRYIQNQMQGGLTFKQAFSRLKSEYTQMNIYDVFSISHWKIQLDLWKNSAHVMRSGKNSLPMVEFHGLPSVLLAPTPQKPASTGFTNNNSINKNNTNVVDEILGNVLGSCNDDNEIPCP